MVGEIKAVDATGFAAKMTELVGEQPPLAFAVAVSGGADSMALTLLLKDYCEAHHLSLHALHVNHKLRPEATQEAAQVQGWLTARNIPCTILTPLAPIAEMQGNVMQNARQVRYQLMQDYCNAHHIAHLCTAHHLQDQAETVLMRLGRASGVEGLAGMRMSTHIGGMTLLRPLLDCPKEALIDYLEAQQQPWLEDPSNHNPAYLRARIRRVLPTLEQAGITSARIAQSAMHLARAADFLQTHTEHWLQEQHCMAGEFYARLPMSAWCALHAEIRLRSVRTILKWMNPEASEIRFDALNALHEAMLPPATYTTTPLHGCVIIKHKACFLIAREAVRLPSPVSCIEGNAVWDGRFILHTDATSLTFGALGREGVAQLKAQHISLPTLPYVILMTMPALWHLDEVIAAPHIRYIHPTWKKLTYNLHNLYKSPIDIDMT
jgi:tRNA(Ile)-lysidine synthase